MRRGLFFWRRRLLVGGLTALVLALFVGFATNGGPGFPLDDAWIHQTYARNLVRSGRWEFVPGVISAGSTAPLWTLLLSVGYWLGLPYLPWTYFLGGLTFWWLVLAAMRLWRTMRLWRSLWPERANEEWVVGVVLVLTWPLVWAAASGMETLLFAALGLSVLVLYLEWGRLEEAKSRLSHLSFLGVLSGLLVLTRPDGLVLLLLLAVGLSLDWESFLDGVKRVGVYLGTAVLPLLPYFAFNLWTSGNVWPNTFYAKQTEYAVLLAQPFSSRLSRLLYFNLGGPEQGWRGISSAHLLLLPGLAVATWLALRKDGAARRLYYLMPLLWAGGHIALYAWRLPVTYQHGRYLLPAVPIWILYGLAGWWVLLTKKVGSGRFAWLARRVGTFSFALLLLFFLFLGAQAYANDVAFIQGEMVDVAHWLARHTAPDAVIASHDIGAIGYFSERPLLDLAGLISPEIIPLLANESRLAGYIFSSEADYLVTAPGWPYTAVTASDMATLVYDTDFAWTQQHALNNMSVYRLETP